LIRYELIKEPSFDFEPLAGYLGFDLDRSAQAQRVGASPAGILDSGEMKRLHEIVEPLARQLGYVPPAIDAA
jgi:hypothetical protein